MRWYGEDIIMRRGMGWVFAYKVTWGVMRYVE